MSLLVSDPWLGTPRPATLRKVSRPGDDEIVYVVTGVAVGDKPSLKPLRELRIRRDVNEIRCWLELDGARHSAHPTLRRARRVASEIEIAHMRATETR